MTFKKNKTEITINAIDTSYYDYIAIDTIYCDYVSIIWAK